MTAKCGNVAADGVILTWKLTAGSCSNGGCGSIGQGGISLSGSSNRYRVASGDAISIHFLMLYLFGIESDERAQKMRFIHGASLVYILKDIQGYISRKHDH